MTISMYEAFPSRELTAGDQPTLDVAWIVSGTEDESMARLFVQAGTPTAYSGLLRQSVHLKQITPDTWEGTVRYGAWKEPEAGDWKWDFDAGSTNQKITQSKQTVANYAPAGEVAPDFGGAIGVSDDAIEGCDIIIPQFHWSETHQLSNTQVTWRYSEKVGDLVGGINDATFRGFGRGRVLFLGAKGSQSAKSPDLVEITFNFAAERDATGLSVGDIDGIAKKAWDYLWVRYGTQKDEVAKKLIKRPTSVHVERVYSFVDFSQLGIGTSA